MNKKFLAAVIGSLLAVMISSGIAKPKKSGEGNITWISSIEITEIENFSEGLARFKKDNKYGFMDKTGTVVIEPQFPEAKDFSDGLARVCTGVSYGQWGYIDKTGKYVITPQFDYADDFHEGLANIVKGPGEAYYIDKTGKAVIKHDYYHAGGFSEGLALVREKALFPFTDRWGYKWGFIDKTGKEVIKPQFHYASGFSEGVAMVENEGINGVGYIDKSGKLVFETGYYERKGVYSEGMVSIKNYKKNGYMDNTGKLVFETQFENLWDFSDGLAMVSHEVVLGDKLEQLGKNSSYIDKTGKTVLQVKYDAAGQFSEGLAKVKKKESGNIDKYGYIDKSGKVVIEPQFYGARDFSEGVAIVYVYQKWGLLINPLKGQEQEKSLSQSGQFIGDIKSVSSGVVIVGGSNIGERVMMGDKLCLYSGDNLVLLRSTFPMMTTVKCEVISGSLKDIKSGMKVYKYIGIKKKEKNDKDK